MNTTNLIYLDNNATTPIDNRVLEVMLPYFTDYFGNSSSTHHFGTIINSGVAKAREQVANLLGALSKEIIFTSGATEAINLALKGVMFANQHKGKHLITCETEHKAVLDTCQYLERIGFNVTYLPTDSDGMINLSDLQNALTPQTILVAIMWVNNETGVIQPIKEIIELVHQNDSLFFTDATQAVGKIPIDVAELEIDLLSFSAHKFYGPKGVGGLYVQKGVKLDAQTHGGGHEFGLRSGTINVPSIIGLGKACDIAYNEIHVNTKKILNLKKILEVELLKIEGVFVNGHSIQCLYNTLNVSLPNFDANFFIDRHRNIAISNGSACTAALVQPSHVLRAMGLSEDQALGSLRISLGKQNTIDEIKEFIHVITTYLSN